MDERSKKTLLRWWQSMVLSPTELDGMHIQPAPSAHKAQLKRCESVDAVMLTEGFRALWLSLSDDATRANHSLQQQSQAIECWAIIASALVYVKKNSNSKFAEAAGKKAESAKSVVSELRFAQLQNAKTSEEFLRRLRRILQQIKGEVSVVKLASDIFQWFDEHRNVKPRKADKRICVRWAMEYYRAAASGNQ